MEQELALGAARRSPRRSSPAPPLVCAESAAGRDGAPTSTTAGRRTPLAGAAGRSARAPRGAAASARSAPRRASSSTPGRSSVGRRPRRRADRGRRAGGGPGERRRAAPRGRPSVGVATSSSRGPGARPPAHARRQHQLQPAGRGRAVLARHPEPEAHELRRRAGLERAERLGQALRVELARLRHVDDHADHAPAPERDQEHAADARRRRAARAAGSRTARAARGRWSAARPWRSPSRRS